MYRTVYAPTQSRVHEHAVRIASMNLPCALHDTEKLACYLRKGIFLYYVSLAFLGLYLTCTLWLIAPTGSVSNANDENAALRKCSISSDVRNSAPVQTLNSGPSASSSAPTMSGSAPSAGPCISWLNPSAIAIGEAPNKIVVHGDNFGSAPKVRFDGVERQQSVAINSKEIVAPLHMEDFAAPGSIVVSIDSPERNAESNFSNLIVQSSFDNKAIWHVFGSDHAITLELRLILLVLFVGCFTASISGMKSFSDYTGQKELVASWYWFYFAQPVIGAGLAFVFYLVARAGFLAGTSADIKSVNPYGFVAVAALVGMFSDAAYRKLNEVFDTFFQAKDSRSDKLTLGLTITSDPRLPPAVAGTAYSFEFQASGGKSPYTWSTAMPPPGLTLNSAGRLTGTPPAPAPETSFSVQVTDSGGSQATLIAKLTVT